MVGTLLPEDEELPLPDPVLLPEPEELPEPVLPLPEDELPVPEPELLPELEELPELVLPLPEDELPVPLDVPEDDPDAVVPEPDEVVPESRLSEPPLPHPARSTVVSTAKVIPLVRMPGREGESMVAVSTVAVQNRNARKNRHGNQLRFPIQNSVGDLMAAHTPGCPIHRKAMVGICEAYCFFLGRQKSGEEADFSVFLDCHEMTKTGSSSARISQPSLSRPSEPSSLGTPFAMDGAPNSKVVERP